MLAAAGSAAWRPDATGGAASTTASSALGAAKGRRGCWARAPATPCSTACTAASPRSLPTLPPGVWRRHQAQVRAMSRQSNKRSPTRSHSIPPPWQRMRNASAPSTAARSPPFLGSCTAPSTCKPPVAAHGTAAVTAPCTPDSGPPCSRATRSTSTSPPCAPTSDRRCSCGARRSWATPMRSCRAPRVCWISSRCCTAISPWAPRFPATTATRSRRSTPLARRTRCCAARRRSWANWRASGCGASTSAWRRAASRCGCCCNAANR